MNEAVALESDGIHRLRQAAASVVVVALVFGIFAINKLELFAGYAAIIMASVLPTFVWLRHRAAGMPILPVAALVYAPTYAVSVFTKSASFFNDDQVFAGQITIAAFLVVACLAWSMLAFRKAPRALIMQIDGALAGAVLPLVFFTLVTGAVFELGVISNWWMWLGTYFGVFRTICETMIGVGSFFFGEAIGRKRFSGTETVVGVSLVALIVLIQLSDLYLYTVVNQITIGLIAYTIAAKRIPWPAIVAGILFVAILQAAKGEMRQNYWRGLERRNVTISDVPEVIEDWLERGATNVASGSVTRSDQNDLLQRLSQLNMLLLVQEKSPQVVPFLYGTTYENFPLILVPRFISPDKIISQTNLNLLSVRYGLLTQTDTVRTTLSWGLVAEGFANYGYLGVLAAAVAFGLLAGGLSWITVGAPALSFRGLIGLSSMVTLLSSTGYDFSYMLLNLLQSIFSVSVFAFALGIFVVQRTEGVRQMRLDIAASARAIRK